MFRPRLRTSTGCVRCRQRKIKCDEERPICKKCSRWNFECVFPTEQKPKSDKTEFNRLKTLLAMTHSGRAPSLQCYQDGYLAAGYESFQDENQRQLVESAVEFVRRYTSLGISQGRGDLSFVTTLILQSSWSRLALSAFSAGAISRWDNHFETLALNSYQAALVELRFNISLGRVRDTDVRCLTSVFFLGMVEVLLPICVTITKTDFQQYFAHGNPKAAFKHFSVIARMAVVLQEMLSNSIQEDSSRWIIAMISMSIVLCANCYWILPSLYTLFEGEWESLDKFIFFCVLPMAENYRICLPEDALKARVQLHINRILYQGPTSSNVRTALQHIDHLETFLATTNPVSTNVTFSNAKYGWRADICSCRMFIAVIAEPFTCSNDPRLRLRMDEWNTHNTKFLQSLSQAMPHMEVLLPMTELNVMGQLGIGMYYLPFLCIVNDLEWFEEIAGVYYSLKIILDDDMTKKIHDMIEMIRNRKKRKNCTLEINGDCSGKHDGLDVLRHPQGFLC